MGNTEVLLITIGLQRDEEKGDVAILPVQMSDENAVRVILEEEECALVREGGALYNLINAYAELCGYQRGWFVRAELPEGE